MEHETTIKGVVTERLDEPACVHRHRCDGRPGITCFPCLFLVLLLDYRGKSAKLPLLPYFP